MKRFLLIIAIVAASVCLIWLGWYNYQNYRQQAQIKTAQSQPMHWGALIRAYALTGPGSSFFDPNSLLQQMKLLKQMGATDVRANIEANQQVNDDFVNDALKLGLKPTLIIEPPQTMTNYQEAFNYAKQIAARYRGKVPYYQLANELSGMAIKPNYPGNKVTDYDNQKFQEAETEIRGFSDGVKAGDPSAERIVSANWLGTGAIDRLVADGVQFEIIGWDWYSDMGDDLIKQIDGQTLNIPEYLKHYGKQFWIVEANLRQGTLQSGWADQASYLSQLITNTASHHNIQGFFVFTFTDQCDSLNQQSGNLGLITLKRLPDGDCQLGQPKTAYYTVQKLIKQIGTNQPS